MDGQILENQFQIENVYWDTQRSQFATIWQLI